MKHIWSNVVLKYLHIIFMYSTCVYVIILFDLILELPKKLMLFLVVFKMLPPLSFTTCIAHAKNRNFLSYFYAQKHNPHNFFPK